MFSFFKRRDAAVYPADPLGDALYKQYPTPNDIPETVALWFDIYFKREQDADAMAAYARNQRVAVEREHDPSMENEPTADRKGTFGAWNVEFQLPVKGRHRDLQLTLREVERTTRDYSGHIGGWLIVMHDENEAET